MKGKRERILFHADDYGASPEISRQILSCCRKGALDSLSVLPNSPHLKTCMDMLGPYRRRLKISVHLNLAEGPSAADAQEIPLLTDERGMLSISFLKLLLLSFTGKRRELKRQLKTEMRAQLVRMLPYVETFRLDSHQHYHMIPVVLESILEAAGDLHREITFLRIPAEPVLPFLRHPSLYTTYRPVNMIKQAVLKVLYGMDRKLLAPYRKKSAVFFGILLSGRMDLERVGKLLPAFWKIAEKKGMPLEVLCHPGGTADADTLMDPANRDCAAFYTSPGRKAERRMLMGIEKRLL